MKKIFFILVCLFTCLGIVNAKTQIEYDWGRYQYVTSGDSIFLDYVYSEEGTKGVFFTGGDVYYIKKDKDDNQILRKSMDGECTYHNALFAIVEDEIICLTEVYENSEYVPYIAVFDEELNVLNVQNISDIYFESYFANLRSENDKYYVWGNAIYDKEKRMFVNLEEVLEDAPSFDLFLENDTDENFYKCLNEVLYDTHYVLFNEFILEFGDRDDIIHYLYQDGYLSIVFYDEENDTYGLEIYNEELKKIFTTDVKGIGFPGFFIKDNRVFIFELIYLEEVSENYEDITYLKMYEYDMNGNLISENNLSTILDSELSAWSGFKLWGREIFKVIPVEGGFLLTTHTVVSFKDFDPTLNEEDTINGNFPTIQKYSFIYNVETKASDSGSIVVDRENSKNGEMIRYSVQPKEGYKLDKVLVTDESGKTIEIKDSSFVMPSSNVTVEAVFVVENPNTGVFLKVGIACIIAFVCYFFIILKNMKVKQYE